MLGQDHQHPECGAGAPHANGSTTQEPGDRRTGSLLETCWDLRRRVLAFLEEDHGEDKALQSLQGHVRVALEVIGEALRRFGLQHLSLSYNGGKDCLVLLVMILACLPELDTTQPDGDANHDSPPVSHPTAPKPEALTKPLQAIYIVSRDPFPEVEDFVASSASQYHLDLSRQAVPMRQALDAYLAEKPNVKAIFMGTRRTDPHSSTLGHFSPTDRGWPQFMRINPIIDWHYADIWAFIRHLKVPYCSLYDNGFTSLGGVSDTRPNPALAIDAEAGLYRPAHELTDEDEERCGRGR